MSNSVLRVREGGEKAVALVLHGGRSKSHAPVRATQGAVLRMLPFALGLHHAGLSVARLRYRVRGWNGAERSPVADVEQALDRLAEQFPGQPIALVGHSMGGRAAVYAAAHPAVRAVALLAPWLEPGDPVATVAARRVLVAHGDRDRTTDPRASAAWAREAARLTESLGYVTLTGERHAMLGRPRIWTELVVGFVTGALLGTQQDDGAMAPAVAGVLAGEITQTV